jgi:hypothetical protein
MCKCNISNHPIQTPSIVTKTRDKWGRVAEFGPVFNFSHVHKHETLQKENKYGNKISIICTFVSYIYRDQKHLMKVGLQEKLNY